MTTIAWDGVMLAADTLATWGDSRDGHFVKIRKRGPILAGASGKVAHCQAFLDWFTAGMKGDPPKMPEGDNVAFGMIVGFEDWILTWGPLGWERVRSATYTMGSGASFADGALTMRAGAPAAVQVAMRHDTKSGGEVTVLRRHQ